eukprot:2217293-Amphidinium_carterae.1
MSLDYDIFKKHIDSRNLKYDPQVYTLRFETAVQEIEKANIRYMSRRPNVYEFRKTPTLKDDMIILSHYPTSTSCWQHQQQRLTEEGGDEQ